MRRADKAAVGAEKARSEVTGVEMECRGKGVCSRSALETGRDGRVERGGRRRLVLLDCGERNRRGRAEGRFGRSVVAHYGVVGLYRREGG